MVRWNKLLIGRSRFRGLMGVDDIAIGKGNGIGICDIGITIWDDIGITIWDDIGITIWDDIGITIWDDIGITIWDDIGITICDGISIFGIGIS